MPSLDIDIDIDISQPNGRPVARRSTRRNTDLGIAWAKYGPIWVPETAKIQACEFPEHWDPDLRSYTYLNDFIVQHSGWFVDLKKAAETAPHIPPQKMNKDELREQVMGILAKVKERDARLPEIIDQDDGNGALSYWRGILGIDPARHPWTNLMLRVGRRVGEHVVMCLKGEFKSPRPWQLCPAIYPVIDPPVTPSFPAGHALQAYLISYLLAYALPNLPQHELPAAKSGAKPKGLLFDLAKRVSDNRIVAGIHYQTDIDAGEDVAIKCFQMLKDVDSIWKGPDSLMKKVQGEFSQYA